MKSSVNINAAKEAIKQYDKEQKEKQKKTVFHNTRLLLKHYNDLKSHLDNAIDDINSLKNYEILTSDYIDMDMEILKQKQIKLCSTEKYESLKMFYIDEVSYDDIGKIGFGILILAWYIFVVSLAGKLMIKHIPKHYVNNHSEMFDLYTASFTSAVSALIGILGTFYGAIYGGKKTLEAVEKQIIKQDEDNKFKEEENKKMLIRIITKFLKEEIIDNKNEINKTSIYGSLNKGFKVSLTYNLKQKIKFDSYERIKYDLIKYTDVKLVEDVIDTYELLYLLVRYSDLNQLNEKEYYKLVKFKDKINNLLEQIDY